MNKENKLTLKVLSLSEELLTELYDIDYKTKVQTANLMDGVYILRISSNKELLHQEKIVIVK